MCEYNNVDSQHADFTGERILPELDNYFFHEHLARYRFSISLIKSSHNVVDIGCGDGYGIFYLSKYCTKAVGIDVDSRTIQIAKNKYQAANLSYQSVDKDQWQLSDKFDLVTCFEVFEHVPEPEVILRKIQQILRPGGILIISTPNIEVFGENLEISFHEKEYSLDEFKELIEKHFIINCVYGQRYKKTLVKKWNFFISNLAMRHPILIKLVNLFLRIQKKRDYTPDYFDTIDLGNNLFSTTTPETADYFILVCRKPDN